MFKIIHVFSDATFLSETKQYKESSFENTIVIIGETISFNSKSGYHPIILSASEDDLRKVVTICSSADIVVLYELDSVKSYIALSIPQNIIIAWRFFGAELYDRNIANYLSQKSLILYNNKKEKLYKLLNLNTLYGKIKSLKKNRLLDDNHFTRAIERIDLFMCLSKQEYNHLSIYWKNLPPFFQIPTNFKFPQRIIKEKTNLVIIGNSRSIFNNHMDIIDLIESKRFSNQIHFLIPFSYGIESHYTSEIRRRVKKSQKNIELLDNFMSYESYFSVVSKAKVAVYNGLRQMAMGNICESINSGVKVYLNSNNIIYQWLNDFGLKIFTIEEFASDLENDNLELDPAEKEKNIYALNNMMSQFTIEQFIIDINSFIEKKKIVLQ